MVKDEIELGMLVQVEAVNAFQLMTERVLNKHGYLWTIQSPVLPDGYVWCKSIATGHEYDWHHHDLNLPPNPEEEEDEC